MLPLLFLIFVSIVNAQDVTTSSAKATTDAKTKLKQQIQLVQEQKRTAIFKATDEAKTLIQTKREEFKANILKIKDQRKKTLVEKIDARIAEVNKNQTSRFSEILTTLQGFLDKIRQSATDTKVLEDIALAQSAIDLAKDGVNAQATKTYTMNITDDMTLRVNAGTVVSQFRKEITAVYELVINAKQAIQKLNAERNLIKKEATSSANL